MRLNYSRLSEFTLAQVFFVFCISRFILLVFRFQCFDATVYTVNKVVQKINVGTVTMTTESIKNGEITLSRVNFS